MTRQRFALRLRPIRLRPIRLRPIRLRRIRLRRMDLRPALVACTLLMIALAWVVVAAEDHGIQPLVGGEWQSRADVSAAIDFPCDAVAEICVEWCEVASNGTVEPTGRLCCKPRKTFDRYDPTCAKPVSY